VLGLNLTAQIKVYTYNTYYNILLLLLTRFVCYSPKKKTGFVCHEVWTTFGLVVCFLVFLDNGTKFQPLPSVDDTRLTVTEKHKSHEAYKSKEKKQSSAQLVGAANKAKH